MEERKVVGTKVAPRRSEQFGFDTEYEAEWRGYCVGSRDEAYEKLERIERQRADKGKQRAH